MYKMMAKERKDKHSYWHNELKSLGIEPKRKNELNDKEELQDLADSIKSIIKITRQLIAMKK